MSKEDSWNKLQNLPTRIIKFSNFYSSAQIWLRPRQLAATAVPMTSFNYQRSQNLTFIFSGSKCPPQESISRHVICYYEGRTSLNNLNVCNCTHIIFTDITRIADNYTLDIFEGKTCFHLYIYILYFKQSEVFDD